MNENSGVQAYMPVGPANMGHGNDMFGGNWAW